MSSRYDATVEAWETAAHAENASAAIHPDGVDPAAYDASGERAAAEVLLLSKRGDSVLDYGCGNGRVLRHVKDRLRYGFDTSRKMLDAAQAACPTAVFYDDLEKLEGCIDLAYSHAVFIHHTHDDGVAMLARLARVLQPGGLLALQIPLYDVAREPETWTGVGVWTPKQLVAAAELLGLDIVAFHTNPGAFSYASPGPNHYRLQLLRRPA